MLDADLSGIDKGYRFNNTAKFKVKRLTLKVFYYQRSNHKAKSYLKIRHGPGLIGIKMIRRCSYKQHFWVADTSWKTIFFGRGNAIKENKAASRCNVYKHISLWSCLRFYYSFHNPLCSVGYVMSHWIALIFIVLIVAGVPTMVVMRLYGDL